MPDQQPVSQRARDAAADLYLETEGATRDEDVKFTAEQIRAGVRDYWPEVQAFAKFEAECTAEVETMRDALRLREAAQAVLDQSFRTYRARNGRQVSVEADDGEACEIVHSDTMDELRAALTASDSPAGLVAALKPFARAAKWWSAFSDQQRITALHDHGDCLEVGHLRQAEAALASSDSPVAGEEMTAEEHRLEDLKQMAAYTGPVVSFDVREPFYLASCDHCGWVGSSEFCGTDSFGDDSDCYCPRCQSSGADCGKVAECIGAKPTPTDTADNLCDDCPPVGYPTDKTRCGPCPRRTTTADRREAIAPTFEDIRQAVIPVIGACLLMHSNDPRLADPRVGVGAEVANAVLALIATPLPDGYVAVPTEPTEAMIGAASRGASMDLRTYAVWHKGLLANWKAMIAARPRGDA